MFMTRKNALILLIAMVFSGGISAQEINTAKLDSFFNALNSNNKGMGSFAISQGNKIVYQKSLGYSLIDTVNKVAATPNTLYRIGSITKTFTATLIFQLIDEKKLTLNTKLAKYFPQIPHAGQITVANLLSHKSGLADYVNDAKDQSWITNPHTKAEILDTITKGKIHFEPGTDQLYCNSGYWLLGNIIEKITGKPYGKVLTERIIKKTGLLHTFSSLPNNSDRLEARAYKPLPSWTEVKDIYFPNVIGVGDILSTPNDMVTFLNALLAGKLVSPESLSQMKSFTDNSPFGMGLIKVPFYNKTGMGHNGGTYGTYSTLYKFADNDLAFASCINGLNYPINDISIAILSICYNQPYQIPSFKAPLLTAQELDAVLGVYASKQIPLKITFSKEGSILIGQATGQSAFPLESVTKDQFKVNALGIAVEFNREKEEMILKQGGMTYLFVKEKN